MNKNFIVIIGSLVVLLLLFSYQSVNLTDKRLHIVFCDVGQGDAIYIRTPGNIDILVDGGNGNRVLECLSKHMPFWDREIELVFATHPDADHITGLVDVIKSYRVISFNTVSASKNTRIFKMLKATIAEGKIPYQEITTGSKFTLSDGVVIETKWPESGFESTDTNEYSLVQIVRYGEFEALLTGDITYQILNTLDVENSSFEIFKLPHHGSKTGVDSSTFEKIEASLAIISAGKNNSYHHPHPSVLNLLRKYNVEYKRTDLDGEIEILTDGKNTKVVN